jgi:zinc/manganese transport system substrate-binding protein
MEAALLLILSRTRPSALLAGLLALALAACGGSGSIAATPAGARVNVVAAENFYGDITQQLGGPAVHVTSIISDPNTDPHEYESSSTDARAISAANLVIENGVGYDGFMNKLLSASPNKNRLVINSGDLLDKKEGDNPHVWYDVAGVEQIADRITQDLQQLDPPASADFATRNQRFKASLQPLLDRMSAMKGRYAGTHLTQTEPVFGYMGEALGLQVDDGEFQHAIEEGTDPSPQSVTAIQQEIRTHTVKALLYNSQTTSPITTQLTSLAGQSNVPVVGVSETEPPKLTYQSWMLSEVDALQKALGG